MRARPDGERRRARGRSRGGLTLGRALLLVLALALVAWLAWRAAARARGAPSATAGRGRPSPPLGAGPLDMPVKPVPAHITFQGCPPEGDRPQMAEFNRLKNRVDEGQYRPVPFDSILYLPWPASVANKAVRRSWSVADRAAVERYEGIPVTVEAYVAGARVAGPESPNCHGADPEMQDWHVWLTGAPGESRVRSVLAEPTPRVRARHRGWSVTKLRRAGRDSTRVRVSGWLLLDPEHPEEIGNTRGTIWEIHPVMRIEVQQLGRWVALDSLTTSPRTPRARTRR